MDPRTAGRLTDKLITFLETAEVPGDLFAPDVFLDLSLPAWRLQAKGIGEVTRLRLDPHPWPGKVVDHRTDPTPTGFVFEFAERWDRDGQSWYCREMLRAEVSGERICAMSVYCTGDWDETQQREHTAAVPLLRP